jgi:hypothetical protein
MIELMMAPRRRFTAALATALVALGVLAGTCGAAPASAVPRSSSEPTTSSSSPNPCTYVSARQAASILHVRSVTTREAPLGPTCIFTPKGGKTEVTLAVEAFKIATDVHEMKHVTALKISGHMAYCGKLGGSLLLVALTKTRVLVVGAPCVEARAFAATALRRIRAERAAPARAVMARRRGRPVVRRRARPAGSASSLDGAALIERARADAVVVR